MAGVKDDQAWRGTGESQGNVSDLNLVVLHHVSLKICRKRRALWKLEQTPPALLSHQEAFDFLH